jgi:hypothetical protein
MDSDDIGERFTDKWPDSLLLNELNSGCWWPYASTATTTKTGRREPRL